MATRLTRDDYSTLEDGAPMDDAVGIVREVVIHHRTRVGTVIALGRAAAALGLSRCEIRQLFYREKDRIRRDRYLALKAAAIAELDARAAELEGRMRAAQLRRQQHELELEKIEAAWGVSASWPRNSPVGQPA
jgi:hypothetical protein